MSEALAVIGTLSGAVLGALLRELIEWLRRPRLEVGFEPGGPCLLFGRFLRVRVSNRGRSAASGCMAKFSFTEADREDWREGEMLHWARHDPDVYGRDPEKVYAPVTIARGATSS